jgi:hypothetical protein
MTFSSSEGSNSVQFLRKTEFFLRRQLQQVAMNREITPIDPYSYTQPTTEESTQSQGRIVLTVLYIGVLSLCFLVPITYYFRMKCYEEQARRELELMDFTTAAAASALEQSEHHCEESRAARRKYIDERRARLNQLMGPVRLVLKQENFPHLLTDPEQAGTMIDQHHHHHHQQQQQQQDQRSVSLLNLDFDSEKYKVGKSDESGTLASEDFMSPQTSDDEASVQGFNNKGHHTKRKHGDENSTLEPGFVETKSACQEENNNKESNPYGDEDALMIRIPVSGLPMGGSCFLDPTRTRRRQEDNEERGMRLAPGLCTICLCNYEVSSYILFLFLRTT